MRLETDRDVSDITDRLRPALSDRYLIEEEIGRGGTATVYLAKDVKHDRKVAIKVLRPDTRPGAYEPQRFLREIRIAARLSHPQILPLHDSGECDGLLYFVMPYAGCESLRDRLTREGPLPVDVALRITRAVGAALTYAHRLNVIHRDIKPENILLQEGEPVVADFGVATALTAAAGDSAYVTDRGLAVGTPAYMSPEQASAEPGLDGRTDQYSLACVLFEMLAGEPPFAGTGPRATMARHAIEVPVPVGSLRPNAPAAIERALARALAKSPDDRFSTMTEFMAALVDPAPEAVAAVTAGAAALAPTIAVLPFVNASADPENEYFSDGMTEEIITALAKVEGLQVASRTSVFALKGLKEDVRALGRRLNVTSVLEGSVRKSGNRLRISVQLTQDGRALWSERYDREMADVFAVQDEIARTIVATLRSTLLGDVADPVPVRYTTNIRAYNLYLKGRYSWNRRTQAAIADGIGYFEQAIQEDPGYALAYTGLSDSYALQVDYRGAPVREGLERAKVEARRALALDDTLAEAHTSLAWVTFIYDWDWAEAGREFQRALELNPRYSVARQWYSWFLVAMGRTEAALAEGRLAIELDPGSVSIRRSMGWLLHYARRPEDALEQLRRALAMNPTAEENHRLLGLAYLQLRMFDEAAAAFREAIASSDSPALAIAGLGAVAAARGRTEEAQAVLDGLETTARERYVSPVAFATVYAALGNADAAFEWVDRAYAERRGWLAYLKVEPMLDPLRTDPRFLRLLERLRLA
ncbi:MAG TPA: protein kinase [Gemmatimonadales bacterium]|jgi:serine/threonine-protein kinase|nr:protein kinase [Gemmatimonadales bacterium]